MSARDEFLRAQAKAMTEAQLQRAVLSMGRTFGWLAWHVADSRKPSRNHRSGWVGDRDVAGLPDTILVRAPRVVFAELKTETGRLTDLQTQALDELGKCKTLLPSTSVEVYVWRPSDLLFGAIETVLEPVDAL